MTDDQGSSPIQYEVSIPSREALLAAVEAQSKPLPYDDIVRQFKLDDERQQIAVKRRLRAMERDGQLVYTKANAYGLPERMDLVKGRVIGHRDGFGFLQVEGGGKDLFLPHHQMQLVLHGDIVLAKEGGTDFKGRTEARIVRVVEAGNQDIVGRFFVEQGVSVVVPDDTRITQDILIPPEMTHGARHGQMVVAKVVSRPSRRSSPVGEVSEILGEHMAPGMEIQIAIREHGIPYEWSAEVQAEVGTIAEEVTDSDKQGRVDLTAMPLVTIDGEDARDFDDAVYCEPEGNGFRLWVAIADVSHYVRPKSALDNEAHTRGTSVYFPDNVVPMLPEKLSNGLCSLNPHVDRLCMVAEMSIDARGQLQKYRFYPAVMNSKARLTYTKVHKMLSGDPQLREQYAQQLPHIEHLKALYDVLKKARAKRGAIEFETTETRFVFNAQRKIEQIVPLHRNVAHMIIEECMIMANVAAARYVQDNQGLALYRVHETPDDERLEGFRAFLSELGLSLGGGDEPQPKDFTKLLQQVAERPDHELIQTLLLRSLKQAIYTPDNEGHFGLALDEYAHFTSPIRRYPDLLLHREIKYQLKQSKQKLAGLEGAFHYGETHMQELGAHCSSTERRADDATRQVDEWLKCEYMQDHVGAEFDGVISTVTNFGFFVRLSELMIDGLVHISGLANEYYHFDAQRHLLIGEHSRRVFRIGDNLRVKVKSVNLDERKIDFDIVDIENAGRIEDRRQAKKITDSIAAGAANKQGSRSGQAKGKGKGAPKGAPRADKSGQGKETGKKKPSAKAKAKAKARPSKGNRARKAKQAAKTKRK
ncbi:ribonuclease R [Aliidiomarina maris]|uniref:Ribonuclease R n=1 Tax=Aliidiomarina maris TaxID=531312 RepID=A0A327WT36_9GAMM|nr:ribonuclease R [Aliidiomarina maris]RAJ95277.1 RNAse R [Aliidiomarina maris]RUO21029.1 ribonuclease R [Aliidiomarina maris]